MPDRARRASPVPERPSSSDTSVAAGRGGLDVQHATALGVGDLDDGVVAVVESEPQRA
jgi:hypothetical protein